MHLELVKDLFAKALQIALRTSVVHANAAIDLAAIVVVHVDLRFEFAQTAGDLHAEVDYRDWDIAPLGRFLVRYNSVDRPERRIRTLHHSVAQRHVTIDRRVRGLRVI